MSLAQLLAYAAAHTAPNGGNRTGRTTKLRPVLCARCGRVKGQAHAGMCGQGVER